MILSGIRWLERLSLDAVIVAVLWGFALSDVAGRTMRAGDLIVLALATWLTYVADRLRDARPGQKAPQTDRHLFHEQHRKTLTLCWLGMFACVFLVAVIFLPVWKLLWGWILVIAIAAYLWFLGQDLTPSKRLLLKRIAVPLIFTLGVAWMAESWRTLEGLGAALVLLTAALSNVLLISYQESRDKTPPAWLVKALGGSLFGMLISGNALLLLDWRVGLACLLCAVVYFGLMLNIGSRGVQRIRVWADATLALAAVLILVLSQ